ncbi:hypothetical protein CTI14_70725, partial [Methylobacterium radiotolerans]
RAQLARYPTVSFLDGEAIQALAQDGGFAVVMAGGEQVRGARAQLARYPTVSFLDGEAIQALAQDGGFAVVMAG